MDEATRENIRDLVYVIVKLENHQQVLDMQTISLERIESRLRGPDLRAAIADAAARNARLDRLLGPLPLSGV